jgi:hypothetical protein
VRYDAIHKRLVEDNSRPATLQAPPEVSGSSSSIGVCSSQYAAAAQHGLPEVQISTAIFKQLVPL